MDLPDATEHWIKDLKTGRHFKQSLHQKDTSLELEGGKAVE
jgi:hypothetical protein